MIPFSHEVSKPENRDSSGLAFLLQKKERQENTASLNVSQPVVRVPTRISHLQGLCWWLSLGRVLHIYNVIEKSVRRVDLS